MRKAWQEKKGDEKKGKELREKLRKAIGETNAKGNADTKLRCCVLVMSRRRGKRPHKVPPLESRLAAEEQMGVTGTPASYSCTISAWRTTRRRR